MPQLAVWAGIDPHGELAGSVSQLRSDSAQGPSSRPGVRIASFVQGGMWHTPSVVAEGCPRGSYPVGTSAAHICKLLAHLKAAGAG